MELLLTPVVNNLLARIIKSADGTSGSRLRVSLSRGSVVLHHLELNLDRYSSCVHLTRTVWQLNTFSYQNSPSWRNLFACKVANTVII